MVKVQITLEYIIILAVIILIGVGFFYFYISSINNQKPVQEIVISNFEINNFSNTTKNCSLGFSFQSTSDSFTANKINILSQNYTGYQFNTSFSNGNYSYYSTPQSDYYYSYNFTYSNMAFCNMFTQFASSNTGEITGLLLYVNKTQEFYQFIPPIKTVYQ